MRGKLYVLALLLGGMLLALACAAQEEAKPAPAAPAPAAPEAAPAWQEEWERVLAAAKREGTVAVAGNVGSAEVRRGFEPFEKRYGIRVEYLSDRAAAFTTRIATERKAGQYLWDVVHGGLTSWIPYLDATIDPIGPALILPEVKDPKSWWGGKLPFLEDEPRVMIMSLTANSPIYFNTNLVKPEDLRSYKDLLDPKWKGKMHSGDPRVGGAALALYSYFYVRKDLGPDFIRALAKQDLTLGRDVGQQMDGLAHGKFPILLGGSGQMAVSLIGMGLPIAQTDPTRMKEGGYVTASASHLYLINRAPHPNAAKVFINWLLTKEGQIPFNRAYGNFSLRLDVPNDWVEPGQRPREDFDLQVGVKVETERKEKARELTYEVFGR